MKTKIQHVCMLTLIALTAFSFNSNAQNYWKLTGNNGTDPAINFLGTSNGDPLVIRTNNLERMRILKNGHVGIGILNPKAALNVFSNENVSLTSPGVFMLGKDTKYNMAFDNSYIQARYNGLASSLYLNSYGGSVIAGNYSNSSYGVVGAGIYEGLYGYTYDSSGIGVYGSSSHLHGVYGYSGGGLGSDPQASSGVYGYNVSYGYGVGGYCYGGSGLYGYSENYIGIFAKGNASWYAGYFDGDVYSTGSYLPSDLKLKKNVKDLTSAMDILNQLHPKQYEYRQDGNYKLMDLPKGNRYGLIADEVEKVLPTLVKETKFNTRDAQPEGLVDPKDRSAKKTSVKNEEIDFKALNYTELIPIIIKAIQEQQATIDNQQSVIANQQQQIDELKQMIQDNGNSSGFANPKQSSENNSAYLLQNAPNPFTQNTNIRCYIPSNIQQAKLVVYNMNGQLLKSFDLSKGMNTVTITAGTLSSGQYIYSLLADGKKIDSKNMSLTK